MLSCAEFKANMPKVGAVAGYYAATGQYVDGDGLLADHDGNAR